MSSHGRKEIVDKRRQQLKEAAYRVVSRKGYNNFTIKDIAREAGLSNGLVHYYFKDKEELLLSLLTEMNRKLKNNTVSAMENIGDPVEKIKEFLRLAFEQVVTEKEYYYVIIDFWSQANRNERMRKANIKLFDSYNEMLTTIIQEGVEKKIFSVKDMKYTVTVIISLMQGLITHYSIDSKAFDYGNYTARITEDVLKMVQP